jgi:hypothetical protein
LTISNIYLGTTTLPPPSCAINCPLSYSSYDTTTSCGRICNDPDNTNTCGNSSTTNFCGPNRYGNDAIYIGYGFRAYGCGTAGDSCGGNGALYLSTGGFTGCCAYTGSYYVCIVC